MDLVRRGYRTNGGNDIGRRRSVTVADGNVAANMKDASLICPQMPEHETSRGRRLGFAGRVRRESARFRARKGGIRAKFRQGKGHQRAVKPPAGSVTLTVTITDPAGSSASQTFTWKFT